MPFCAARLAHRLVFSGCDRAIAVGIRPVKPFERAGDEGGPIHRHWLPGARADVAALLHGFSLFVLPSLAEGTPVSMLEAMACGLPVVASKVGGIPEVVTDGVEGSLVPVQDTEALARTLASYVRDPALRRQRGEAARARVEAAFSMRAMLAEYGKLYDRLCRQKIRQPA